MKKYNKSEIMKRAWMGYKAGQAWNGAHKTFAECLKMEWKIAKDEIEEEKEMERYYNAVCVEVIEKGEEEVRNAYRLWRDEDHSNETRVNFSARMSAWKKAIAVAEDIMPTFTFGIAF